MSQPQPPPDSFDAQPTSGAHANPSASWPPQNHGAPSIPPVDVIALLPTWAKALAVLMPMGTAALGTIGGTVGGGQVAAQERAVLSTKVDRLEEDQREMRAEVASRLDRLTDLILKQRGSP